MARGVVALQALGSLHCNSGDGLQQGLSHNHRLALSAHPLHFRMLPPTTLLEALWATEVYYLTFQRPYPKIRMHTSDGVPMASIPTSLQPVMGGKGI